MSYILHVIRAYEYLSKGTVSELNENVYVSRVADVSWNCLYLYCKNATPCLFTLLFAIGFHQ